MSAQTNHSPSKLLDLPTTWLAHLVQHVALGAGGLASAAALSQTCKPFHALSESSAVTYRNICLDKPLHNLDHPLFRWLADRHGRVDGLTAELRLRTVDGREPEPEPEPEQLQLMFSIPGLHLTLRYDNLVNSKDGPLMTQLLRPHGHLIDHLSSVVLINEKGLTLQDFCEAAAPCRRLEFTALHRHVEPLNMGSLDHLAGSLVRFDSESTLEMDRKVENVSSLSLLSQLTSLTLKDVDFAAEEPWMHLAGFTNLKQLCLWGAASGDPAPLSALTGLSSLELLSINSIENDVINYAVIPYTFSSLQPLSTLQQLEELKLDDDACSATSLHGLAELSRLKTLWLHAPMLKCLEGVGTGLTSLTIEGALQLESLAGTRQLECCGQLKQLSGIEGLTALQQLVIYGCGLTSLQPVGQLVGGLKGLDVSKCRSVQVEVLELPHVQPTANVRIEYTTVREVVLAGGVRRKVHLEEDVGLLRIPPGLPPWLDGS